MNSPFERRVSRLERARPRQLEHDEDCEVTLERLTEMAFTAYRVAIDAGSADAAVKAVAQLSRMHARSALTRAHSRHMGAGRRDHTAMRRSNLEVL